MLVLLCRPDPAETPGDTPAMRVHRKNLPAQRIHQNAARRFLPHTRQRQQEFFFVHRAQRLERRLTKLRHDDVEKVADRTGFLVRQAAAGDGSRDIFGGRFGDLQVGGVGFFQRPESAAVTRLPCFRAAHDEQQFVQWVLEL